LPPAGANESLEQQVQKVASCVTKMILNSMERKHLSAGKSAQRAN